MDVRNSVLHFAVDLWQPLNKGLSPYLFYHTPVWGGVFQFYPFSFHNQKAEQVVDARPLRGGITVAVINNF
jgi:hypothetical protein